MLPSRTHVQSDETCPFLSHKEGGGVCSRKGETRWIYGFVLEPSLVHSRLI